MDKELIETQDAFEAALNAPPEAPTPVPEGATAAPEPTEIPITEEAPDTKPVPAPTPAPEKAPPNAAFAAMRADNAKLNAIIDRLGGALGVEIKGTSLEDSVKVIEQRLIAEEAAKSNLPPEYLQRMQQTEEALRGVLSQQAQENITKAFGNVMQQCALTPEETYSFAEELQEQGYDVKNNLAQLPALYRGMHFDAIVQKKIDAAVQEALTRQNASNESAPTVVAKKGQGTPDNKTPIVTLAELEKELGNLS